MPKEKWNLPESPAQNRPNETRPVEVKFSRTATSFFVHLRFAFSKEIPVYDTGLSFEMSCREVL